MCQLAAELARELNRVAEADAQSLAALALARRIGERPSILYGLADRARAAAAGGAAERAGRLWGAVEREEARGRLVWWEHDRPAFAEAVGAAAGEAFERGLAAGRHLSLDEAVEEALADA